MKGLAELFPVYNEDGMRRIIGGNSVDDIANSLWNSLGGQGTTTTDSNGNTTWHRNDGSSSHPYSQDQYDNWGGNWNGGFVYGWGYVGPEASVYSNSFPNGGSTSFHINGFPYQPWEGGGINASFALNGHVVSKGNQITVMADMSGSYVSESRVASAIEIRVNGQLVSTTPLTVPSNGMISQSGSTPLGFATVDLSRYSGQIEIKLVGSYYNNNSGGGYVGNVASGTIFSMYKP